MVDLLSEDEDEETQLKRALQASKTEAAAKRPQRKAAQEGQSLSTRLAGLKGVPSAPLPWRMRPPGWLAPRAAADTALCLFTSPPVQHSTRHQLTPRRWR